MFGSSVCHWYQVIHEQYTISGKRLILFQIAWPVTQSGSNGALRAVYQDCGILYAIISCCSMMCDGLLPPEKHAKAWNFIVHGKIQPPSNQTNLHSLWLCIMTWSFYRMRCQGEAMFRSWDNRLNQAWTWHCYDTKRDNCAMQLWGKNTAVFLCCNRRRTMGGLRLLQGAAGRFGAPSAMLLLLDVLETWGCS